MGFLAWFALVALVEMATFFGVSSQIGLGPAIVIALGTAFVGAYMVRRAGVAVWRRIRDKIRQSRMPGRELVAGVAILLAGAFLISPGFITDVLGFALLVPAVQGWMHRVVTDRLSSRLEVISSSLGAGETPGDWEWEVTDVVEIEEDD